MSFFNENRGPKIALSGQANEGERKLGTGRTGPDGQRGSRGTNGEQRAQKKRGKNKEGGRGAKGEKDVEARRILESSQNEVRHHEPYINQPRLLSSVLPLLELAFFIFALTVPRSRPCSSLLVDRRARY